MADASVGIYDVEGHKISLQVLTDFSGLLPPEASEIVQRAQDVITTIRVGATLIVDQILRLSHTPGHTK